MQRSSNIGGQAVMEGIMMRHGDEYAIAVRKPDGEIVVKKEKYRPAVPIPGADRIPIVRGVCAFIDSMVTGVSCLMYSAQFVEEDEPEKKRGKAAEKKDGALSPLETALTVVLAVGFSIGLFILLPYFLAGILRRLGASEIAVSLAEALLRIVIFLVYMLLISRMKDIQRVFMYHGSEHKCINCVEHGLPLTVDNVLASSRLHRRCGTSFMLIVVMLSVICFLILGIFGITSPLLRFGLRLLMIPVIAGVAYEFIRFAGRSDAPWAAALSKPGLAMQRLVTREPDAAQAEVAIAAVEAVFDWKAYLRENFPESAAV